MQRMTLLAAVTLIGLGLFDAHAQSSGSSGPPSTLSAPQLPGTTGQAGAQAPKGHRQPRVSDVPKQGQIGSSPADAEIDQKLTICRDCR
jgi:hypothetical protein